MPSMKDIQGKSSTFGVPRLLVLFLAIGVTAIVYGCSSSQPKISETMNISFRELVAIDEMNEYFQISVDSQSQEKLEFGSDIKVVFVNRSDWEIYFPVGYGIRLFIIENDKWVEIDNNDEYYGDGSLLRSVSEQGIGGRLVTWVRPVLPTDLADEGNPEILRIVMVGELLSAGEKTGIPVGAYVDLFLAP